MLQFAQILREVCVNQGVTETAGPKGHVCNSLRDSISTWYCVSFLTTFCLSILTVAREKMWANRLLLRSALKQTNPICVQLWHCQSLTPLPLYRCIKCISFYLLHLQQICIYENYRVGPLHRGQTWRCTPNGSRRAFIWGGVWFCQAADTVFGLHCICLSSSVLRTQTQEYDTSTYSRSRVLQCCRREVEGLRRATYN